MTHGNFCHRFYFRNEISAPGICIYFVFVLKPISVVRERDFAVKGTWQQKQARDELVNRHNKINRRTRFKNDRTASLKTATAAAAVFRIESLLPHSQSRCFCVCYLPWNSVNVAYSQASIQRNRTRTGVVLSLVGKCLEGVDRGH